MKDILLRLLREEKGSVIAIVAVGFTVFLGMVAMATDVGLLYYKQNKIAHAMDAAALAGAQELPYDSFGAVAVAKSYAQLNGLNPDSINVTIANDQKSLTVSSSQNINLIFARFLGSEASTVSATAKAKVAPVKTVTGAVPFSVMEQTFDYGTEYVLKEGSGGDPQEEAFSGWFRALDFTGGGGGANEYEDFLRDGFSGEISIGDTIDIQTGLISNPTTRAVQDRIDSCNHVPRCTWDAFSPDCKRVIYVPVIQRLDDRTVRVVGFAAFFLIGVEGQGNENNVTGYFIQETISAEIDDSLTNYGLQGIKLTN